MMKPKVLVTKTIPEQVVQYLSPYCDCTVWDRAAPLTRQQLIGMLGDVDGLLTTSSSPKIDRELLNAAPRLKAVCNMSVGYDNMDIHALKERSIIATNTPDVLNDTVADLAFALILGTSRRICELDRYVREGSWKKKELDEQYFGTDVHHATLGIIGMGRIGEVIARRAKYGFDMNVLYYNRRRREFDENRIGASYSPMEELLAQSDIIVVMTPLTPETQGMIGAREFAMMKKQPLFINVSRGATVVETALIQALRTKQIRGAGLDVFQTEPIQPGHPLLELDNVLVLPHIGSATHSTRTEMAMLAARNLVSALYEKEVLTQIV